MLTWIAADRPEILQHIRVITGSSVGAINGCFLASRGLTPESVLELEELWVNLEIGRVLNFSSSHAARMLGSSAFRLVAKRSQSPATGLFETSRFEELIRHAILWDEIPKVVRSGRFDAMRHRHRDRRRPDPHLRGPPPRPRPTALAARPLPHRPHRAPAVGARAALLSIPFVFPPVQIGDYWYTDGGLRHNTPLSPALRLGADRLLVVALAARSARIEVPGVFPGLGQLLGKLFNSLFLDRMAWDLDRLDRINDLLTAGTRLYGSDFIPKLYWLAASAAAPTTSSATSASAPAPTSA